jgi:propionyl-CoA carboxylase alpha chain
MPSTGRLTTYRPPAEEVRDGVTVRNDTGVHEGGEVSVYYDPMIAKLVTHAPSRAQAIASQAQALDAFAIEGIRHNLPFLSTLMRHPRWQEGRLSTGFISEEFPEGFSMRAPSGDMALRFAAIAFAVDACVRTRNRVAHADSETCRTAVIGDSVFTATVEGEGTRWQIRFGEQDAAGTATTISSDWRPGQRVWQGVIAGEPVAAQLRTDVDGFLLSHAGQEALVQVTSAREAELLALMPKAQAAAGASGLLSPMPGTVLSVAVKPGQAVSAGDALCVIEAMKMEIVLRAERSAEVSSIHVGQGDAVAADAVIMEFV